MGRIYKTHKANGEKKTRTIGVVTTEAVEKEVAEIAVEEERTKSYIGEALMLRGLAAYRRDGLLKEPEINLNETATESVNDSSEDDLMDAEVIPSRKTVRERRKKTGT